jgi:thiol-disulfide isomerase/thioredoxin
MNKFLLIATVLAISNLVSAAGTYKKSGDVLILTDKNFEAAKAEFPKMFVKYYAAWCPHCKKIAPKWKALAKEYAGQEDGVVFAKVNAEKHPNTANDENVSLKALNLSRIYLIKPNFIGNISIKPFFVFLDRKLTLNRSRDTQLSSFTPTVKSTNTTDTQPKRS